MNADEIKVGLISLDPKHPFKMAVEALMAGTIEDEQAATVIPNLTDAARHFNAGRLANALDFKNGLAELIDSARKEEAARNEEMAEKQS